MTRCMYGLFFFLFRGCASIELIHREIGVRSSNDEGVIDLVEFSSSSDDDEISLINRVTKVIVGTHIMDATTSEMSLITLR